MSQTLLDVKNLSIIAPHKTLCDKVEFSIPSAAKVALVARNGAWKSTLLKIVAGKDEALEWDILYLPRVKVWYLSQTDEFDLSATVQETLFAHDNEQWQAIVAYEKALAEWNDDALEWLVEQLTELDAWDYESKVNIVINQLQLKHLLDQKIETCSGWELKRLSLAKILIDDPDFLILDEPTNHLDLEMIERLETYLKRSNRTLLLVTHDRYFLERVCDKIIELDHGKIYSYPGNYTKYRELKAKRMEEQDKQRHKMKQVMRREVEWMRKAPRARETKSSHREKEFYDLESTYKDLKRTAHKAAKKLDISIEERRIGGKILRLHNVCKSYGEKIITNGFSYDFRAGERVWLIWKNWVGKSTFIKLLMEQETPDTWEVRRGETIQMWLYEQKQKKIDESKKVIDVVKDIAEYITIWWWKRLSAAQLLEQFLFDAKQQHQKAYTLSGWERRRLHLLTILIANPNFLILDEPTNDLDIATLQILEDFLMKYRWCLVIVSHDRFFMDKVVDHLLVFEGAWVINDFPGNYSERAEYRRTGKSVILETKQTEEDEEQAIQEHIQSKKSLTNKEREEYQMITVEIEKLEQRRQEINTLFQQPNLDHSIIKDLSQELAKISERLEEFEERWFELEERV